MLRREVFEHIHCSRPCFGFPAARVRLKIQFVEEDFRELRRRIDVELRARELPDLLF